MIKRIGIITLLLSFVLGSTIYAHSGRTDSSGGHNCSAKSQAKGLCSGYHYHNGGTAESSHKSNSTFTTPTQSSDKDCSDFSSYEEVVEYWNSKGYTKENDPERLDGWGNTVDDGIPCEAPSGYDTSKINHSPAQIAKITAENDKATGEKEGYSVGYTAGYSDTTKNTSANGSDDYIQGYQSGYEKGYLEGNNKLHADKEKAKQTGYEFGAKQDQLVIPDTFKANTSLQESFTIGFNEAVSERDEKKKAEYAALGYQDGKDENDGRPPKNIKDLYIASYNEGFEKGQSELKVEYKKQGYEAAFTMLIYKKPQLETDKYVGWYKEGFESNKEIKEIQDDAYNLGLQGEAFQIPDKYQKAKVIFDEYYHLGKKEHATKQEEKRTTATASTVAGMGIIGWFARRFYVARKMAS
ncbi:YHYH domain-containing protein [Peribacillus loiseleuriae]|uniref:YHYH domain-containing protein n=1 Tax=Peribacillus loiseleuriae TaxID=1679170 RepID=A0A0K9GWJ0_9BACI|nr:YHYH domain-containing protein [Peribacillus loiseleuriae]KMY50988.1 hypothetical protein AC625_16830 [Peribacillus loiseleuriae]